MTSLGYSTTQLQVGRNIVVTLSNLRTDENICVWCIKTCLVTHSCIFIHTVSQLGNSVLNAVRNRPNAQDTPQAEEPQVELSTYI